MRPEAFALLGDVVASSPTLASACVRAAKFIGLTGGFLDLSLHVGAERSTLALQTLYPHLIHPESAEFAVGTIGMIARRITGEHLVPLEVRFAHSRPAVTHVHEQLFGSPVYFDRAFDGLVFESDLLHIPVQEADISRCARLDEAATEALQVATAGPGDLTARIQAIIAAELGCGDVSVESIANRLGLSYRTLCRRLRREGTSHSILLDEHRRRLAERYMRDPNLSISEVAEQLGYSDPTSFYKAFRRWTGRSPREYRRLL
jgi:AraC-like DNA-binding protein